MLNSMLPLMRIQMVLAEYEVSKGQAEESSGSVSCFSGCEFWGRQNVLDSLKQTFMNFSQSASKVSDHVSITTIATEFAKSNADSFCSCLNLTLVVLSPLHLPALVSDDYKLLCYSWLSFHKFQHIRLLHCITISRP